MLQLRAPLAGRGAEAPTAAGVIGAVLSVLPALFFLHPPVSREGAWGLTEQTSAVLGILNITEKSLL